MKCVDKYRVLPIYSARARIFLFPVCSHLVVQAMVKVSLGVKIRVDVMVRVRVSKLLGSD